MRQTPSGQKLLKELESQEIEELFPFFQEHGITSNILWTLTPEDLKELGASWIQRKKYFAAKDLVTKSGSMSGKSINIVLKQLSFIQPILRSRTYTPNTQCSKHVL